MSVMFVARVVRVPVVRWVVYVCAVAEGVCVALDVVCSFLLARGENAAIVRQLVAAACA